MMGRAVPEPNDFLVISLWGAALAQAQWVIFTPRQT
jgi:hypothetical protein